MAQDVKFLSAMSKSTLAASLAIAVSIFVGIIAYAAAAIPLRTVSDMYPPSIAFDAGTHPRPAPLR